MTPRYPNTVLDLPDIATDSAVAVEPSACTFRASIARAAYEEAGIGPEDLSLAEVYDLSTALELQWYEGAGAAGRGGREAAAGGCHIVGRAHTGECQRRAGLGEAVPAQAIAQVRPS